MDLQPIQPGQGVSSVGHPHERQTVAITKTEFLTDSVRVYYFCRRPWGANDERSMVELPYAAIPALPNLALDHAHGEFREAWVESVYVPACNATICFRFAKWQETDDCRMEGLVGGPYLATTGGPDANLPSHLSP